MTKMNVGKLKALADAADKAKTSAAWKEAIKQIDNVMMQAEVVARAGNRILEYRSKLNKLAIDQLKTDGFEVRDVAEEGYLYMISGW
jgi:hypothetical protein